MKLKKNFKLVSVAGEHFVTPVGKETYSFGGVVALSEPAHFLLSQMSEEKNKDSLVQLLTDEYDVDRDTAEADVEKIMESFLSLGIVDE